MNFSVLILKVLGYMQMFARIFLWFLCFSRRFVPGPEHGRLGSKVPRRPPRAPGTLQATVGEKTKKPNHIVIDISISIVIIICSGIRMCFVSPPPADPDSLVPRPCPCPCLGSTSLPPLLPLAAATFMHHACFFRPVINATLSVGMKNMSKPCHRKDTPPGRDVL